MECFTLRHQLARGFAVASFAGSAHARSHFRTVPVRSRNTPNQFAMAVRAGIRTAIAALGVVATLSLVAGPAGATPTDNVKMSGTTSYIDHYNCADDMRVDSTWDVMVHVFYDAAGFAKRLEFTGPITITYTDLVNGHTFSPNSSGPGTVDLAAGTAWVRGSNAAIWTNDGVLESTDGRIIYDANGNMIRLDGHARPVCEALGTTPKV